MYIEGFPSKLKRARESTEFKQIDIATELKISRATISKYETGALEPSIETLGIMADMYEVSVDWLLGTKGGKKEIENKLMQ